jgi:hypothetical protein
MKSPQKTEKSWRHRPEWNTHGGRSSRPRREAAQG